MGDLFSREALNSYFLLKDPRDLNLTRLVCPDGGHPRRRRWALLVVWSRALSAGGKHRRTGNMSQQQCGAVGESCACSTVRAVRCVRGADSGAVSVFGAISRSVRAIGAATIGSS